MNTKMNTTPPDLFYPCPDPLAMPIPATVVFSNRDGIEAPTRAPMADTFHSLLKERRYPFLFSLSLLLFCVSLILLSDRRRLAPGAGLRPADPQLAADDAAAGFFWRPCGFSGAVDYIPCLDNWKAIKALRSRRHMEHRERHCPKQPLRCLVPLPVGYRTPVPWPKSRDMIWYDNVPHSKLIEYKKDQNWVRRSGDYLVFPGGGTQFKEGVNKYIQFIEEMLPDIKWGKHVRVVLDVGCGVASFGGHLLEKSVITMSLAPKDEHEAQVQFALERGIPAVLSVIGTQRLNFPSNSFDVVHCARCRVHWDADGGLPVLELNRIIRPGGYFIWSATPVYRDNERDTNVWKAMVAITESICWQMVAKSVDSTAIGVVIYQKPLSNSCYKERGVEDPPFCDQKDIMNISWYTPLNYCLPLLPSSDLEYSWPKLWPDRLSSRPLSTELMMDSNSAESIEKDSKYWVNVISSVYFRQLGVNWSGVRNIMDMNAGYGGFAASLIDLPVWVMNVVPINGPDTLLSIFDRGLIGIYHDWCEAFNTYPRTYDLLHCSFLFGNITHRCDYVDLVVEMDRILRPGGWVIIRDSIEMIQKLVPVVRSLHWVSTVHEEKYLVSRKAFWRPLNGGSS